MKIHTSFDRREVMLVDGTEILAVCRHEFPFEGPELAAAKSYLSRVGKALKRLRAKTARLTEQAMIAERAGNEAEHSRLVRRLTKLDTKVQS